MTPDSAQPSSQRKAWRFMAAAALLLAAGAVLLAVILFLGQNKESDANCARIHTLTQTLDKMIADSRQSLDAYVKDGTITAAQRDRELVRIERQRNQLGGADCPARTPRALTTGL